MKAGAKTVGHEAYPLRTVSATTGLSPDLIRAWEKRYGVVSPRRGARGARLYSSADVAHLRLLARVVGAGRAIGDVAGLDRAHLERLAAGAPPEAPAPREAHGVGDAVIAPILERIEQFDRAGIAQGLGDALLAMGSRAFVDRVAIPLLHAIGARWSAGTLSIAQEHLFSNVLRHLVASLIQARSRPGLPTAVLATPAGEPHDLGLLLLAPLVLDAGLDVSYLGADLPAAEIATAARRCGAVVVGLSVVSEGNRAQAVREVREISRALPATAELWLGGRDAAAVSSRLAPFGGVVIATMAQADRELARLGDRVRSLS